MDAKQQKADIVRAQFGGRDPLFGGTKAPKVFELELERIRTNPDQPRKIFDEESLTDLAASIERHGLLQPVMVKRLAEDDGYLLVAGERRYRAVQKLGRTTVTAILTDGNVDEIAIVENLQREDLKPLEEAEALARLMHKHGYTQEQVARVVGKGRTTITGLLLLNDLPESIREQCRTSDIPKSVLIEIGRAKTPEAQLALWGQLRDGRTVRAVRATKRSGAVKDAQAFTTSTKAVAAAKGLLRRLQELGPGELTANRDQYQELVRLRDEIDAILREKSEEA